MAEHQTLFDYFVFLVFYYGEESFSLMNEYYRSELTSKVSKIGRGRCFCVIEVIEVTEVGVISN